MAKKTVEKIQEVAEMLSSVFQAVGQAIEIYDAIKEKIHPTEEEEEIEVEEEPE